MAVGEIDSDIMGGGGGYVVGRIRRNQKLGGVCVIMPEGV